MSRHTVHLIGSVIIAFLLGTAVGTSAARNHMRQRWNPEKRHEQMVKLFSDRLSLTAEQASEVEKILQNGHLRMRSLHEQVRPQFEALRTETSQQIRALLEPEQIEKFDAMEAEFAKSWEKFPGGRFKKEALQ